MFKKVALVFVSLLIISSLFLFSSCNLKNIGKPEYEDGQKTITVVVGETEYTVKTESNYLHEVLLEMKNDGAIDYVFETSSYGSYPTKVGSLDSKSTTNTYIALYHNIDDITLRGDIGEYAMPGINFKGDSYYYSSVGVDMLPIFDGKTYVIRLGSY